MEKKSIIEVKISFPEALRAIKKFRGNRVAALAELTNEIKQSTKECLEALMEAEITAFLGSDGQDNNKRNGYKEKVYGLKGIGAIRVKIPQDRLSKFNSAVIPKNEVIDPRLKEDMAVLSLAGISMRNIRMISRRILGIEVSKDTVASSYGLISDAALKWLERPLTGKYWALYIDGTNFKLQRRGSVEREPSLVVLGIGSDDRKSILAIEPGHKENVESWRTVFSSLKERGFDAPEVKIGIMDGLPGLEKAFGESFPNAVTARCWVHAKRNAVNKCPSRLRNIFRTMVTKVMYANSEQEARDAFAALKERMANDGQRAVYCLEKDLDSLLAHHSFDRCYWTALRTTNPVERVNREFKRRVKTMEGIGERNLNCLLAFTALRLEVGWRFWKADDKRYEKMLSLRNSNALEEGVGRLLQ